ncbi:MAG: helix-turn-helix domain-containing protein [Desulfobacteraceae bacterium]|nr:helix-turn-helix domain-containing protein [Desulfobacteraceae bacterium]
MDFNFEKVLGRAKIILKVEKDLDVAKAIGMNSSAFNNRKRADSIPYQEFMDLANKQNVHFDWLFLGTGSIYNDTISDQEDQSPTSENNNITVITHKKAEPSYKEPPTPSISKLITKTIEILESKTIYSSALSANIQAFHEAAGTEQKLQKIQIAMEERFKKMDDRITELAEENNTLKEQIKNTPENGCGMAASES